MRTLIQHIVFWSSIATYCTITATAASWAGGDLAMLIIAAMTGAPVTAYGNKIRRYLAPVRYRVGCLQRTGDGGNDYWTVIIQKNWIPFWMSPIDHVFRPFLATEIIVDCSGYAPGSVRLNKRPLNALAKTECMIFAIGHDDCMPTPAKELYENLNRLSITGNWKMPEELPHGQLQHQVLDMYCLWVGMKYLVRDGLKVR